MTEKEKEIVANFKKELAQACEKCCADLRALGLTEEQIENSIGKARKEAMHVLDLMY